MNMYWIYRDTPVPRGDIERAIVSSEGYRAGWELDPDVGKSDWLWAEVIYKNGEVHHCEVRRPCSEHEIVILNDLLRGEIVCRYVRVRPTFKAWALATAARP
jgi:hypothetical protein